MRRRIRNLFLRNWQIKLFSLILAFVLWLTLIPEEKTFSEKTLIVPLETHNIPPEMEIVEKPSPAVDVVIRAPNRLINQVSAANVFAKLNLEKATVIQEEYPLNPTMISLPTGAEVVRISPNKVKLRLERTKEGLLDIVPDFKGEMPEGFKIEKVEIFPLKVAVKGPESKVREKDKIRTSPIDISSLNQSVELQADLILPNPDIRLASSQTKVRIRIDVIEQAPQPNAKSKPSKKKIAL